MDALYQMSACPLRVFPCTRRDECDPSPGPGTSLGDGLCRLTSDRGDPGTPNLVSMGLPTLQVQYSTVQFSTVQHSYK